MRNGVGPFSQSHSTALTLDSRCPTQELSLIHAGKNVSIRVKSAAPVRARLFYSGVILMPVQSLGWGTTRTRQL
jgi:hypothetical protein